MDVLLPWYLCVCVTGWCLGEEERILVVVGRRMGDRKKQDVGGGVLCFDPRTLKTKPGLEWCFRGEGEGQSKEEESRLVSTTAPGERK